MSKEEWEFNRIDPLMEEALNHAVEEGCDLRIRGVSDVAKDVTIWRASVEGSFFMAIAGVAELIKVVSLKQAKKFEKSGNKHKDGSPITWEDMAETLLTSSAMYLGYEIRIVGRCNLEEEAKAKAEEMSKYKEI